jgi:hypothetical protein
MTDLLGRSLANILQWVMILYATNADIVCSPVVVIALGSIVFFLSMVDVLTEICWPRERRHEMRD